MKEIKISSGQHTAIVDDEDFEYLNQFVWTIDRAKNTSYARRFILINKKYKRYKTIFMHREIMNTPCYLVVDHKDHNGLNNQKNNLRNCTRRENMLNRKPKGRSKYLGVSICKKEIAAYITVNKRRTYLGAFKTEIEAAKKYDEYARIYHGEFANLNFPDD